VEAPFIEQRARPKPMELLIDEIYSEDSLSVSRECANASASEGAHVSKGVTYNRITSSRQHYIHVGYDGRKADSWSLVVILYAMLAGNLPFSQELVTCKRYKVFANWANDLCEKSNRFREDPTTAYPSFPPKFSPLSRSLIVALLLPNPIYRISVQESVKHPWCVWVGSGNTPIPRIHE
jgi:serine/threonine protein kinase